MSKAIAEPVPSPASLRLGPARLPLVRDHERAGGALIVAGVTTALLLGVFARLMTFEMRRDEQLYVPPARLLDHGELYADFFYNHVPGSALIFHFVLQMLGSSYLLLAGRIAVFGAWLGLAVAVAVVTFSLARSWAIALACVVLLLCNDMLLGPTGATATNNFLPLAFAYTGMGLWVIGICRTDRALLMALAGLSLAAAGATKVNFLIFIPILGLAALILPRHEVFRARLARSVLPFAIGGLIGSLPVFYYMAIMPNTFLSHVLLYHTGPHLEYFASRNGVDDDVAFSMVEKGKMGFLIWFSGTNVLLVLLLIVLMVKSYAVGKFRAAMTDGSIVTVGAATMAAVIVSFVPTPSFPQYFSLPIIGCLLLVPVLYGKFNERERAELAAPAVALTVLVVLLGLPRFAGSVPKLLKPREWTVSRVHADGLAIRSAIERSGVEGKVATLLPIYPLEARLPVYRELATGQFAYRIGDLAKPDLMARYVTTSPSRIEALLSADPPAAILVGFEPALEQPLIHFAQSHGYFKQPDFVLRDRYGSGVLYLRRPDPS